MPKKHLRIVHVFRTRKRFRRYFYRFCFRLIKTNIKQLWLVSTFNILTPHNYTVFTSVIWYQNIITRQTGYFDNRSLVTDNRLFIAIVDVRCSITISNIIRPCLNNLCFISTIEVRCSTVDDIIFS